MSAVLDALRVPVVQAPMAGVSGGALARAVSDAGGLGMVGPGPATSAGWLASECETASAAAAFGVGLMAWVLPDRPDLLDVVLADPPALVSVSFGAFEPYLGRLREVGCEVTTQVGTADEARRALDAGVDLLVVRGAEAGGHGRDAVATLPLLQEVLDLATVPVLAAGGVSGPRGLAAALAAGADGVWVGTAFMLCAEALTPPAARARLVAASSGGTEYSSVFDRGARLAWPPEYGGRYLRSAFTESWVDRVDEIGSDDEAFAAIADAREAGDGDALPVYAGQAAGALGAERPAAEVVADLARGVDLLAEAARRWAEHPLRSPKAEGSWSSGQPGSFGLRSRSQRG